jgi:hypothetical protein
MQHEKSFTPVMGKIENKYIDMENVVHLLDIPRKHYTVEGDSARGLYYRINLNWDYINCTQGISMQNYLI